jgi:ferredoxin-NADP reductase
MPPTKGKTGSFTKDWFKIVISDGIVGLDKFLETYMNSKTFGFTARAAFLAGVTGVAVTGLYTAGVKFEERKPISKRWFPRWTEITLLEKFPMEPGTDVWIYRFALPNPYDTLGYEPISSVLVCTPRPSGWYKGKKRWFTPISHPDQRGVVEFAIKLKDPGYMSSYLRGLGLGSKMYLGAWVKEWSWKNNKAPVVEFLTAGIGVTTVLQLLTYVTDEANKKPVNTKIRLFSFNPSPVMTPFFERLCEIEKTYPELFEVQFAGDNGRWDKHPAGDFAVKKGWIGVVSRDLVSRWSPSPKVIVEEKNADGTVTKVEKKKQILVSGPGPFMTYVCGRTVLLPFLNYYTRAPYGGILKDLGYERSQVYQFPNPWSITTET